LSFQEEEKVEVISKLHQYLNHFNQRKFENGEENKEAIITKLKQNKENDVLHSDILSNTSKTLSLKLI